MPLLAKLKLGTLNELTAAPSVRMLSETLACAYLSFTLLLGLGANYMLGWWWADSLSARLRCCILFCERWPRLCREKRRRMKMSELNASTLVGLSCSVFEAFQRLSAPAGVERNDHLNRYGIAHTALELEYTGCEPDLLYRDQSPAAGGPDQHGTLGIGGKCATALEQKEIFLQGLAGVAGISIRRLGSLGRSPSSRADVRRPVPLAWSAPQRAVSLIRGQIPESWKPLTADVLSNT